MRVPKLSVAFFALVIGAAACNRTDAPNEISTEANLAEDTLANDVLGANEQVGDLSALPTDAAGFAAAVAASDMFEIESAKIAADKASAESIKAFAEKLRTDHEKSSAELKAAAAKGTPPVTVTPKLATDQQAMLDQLKSATGADFEGRFVDIQIKAHQKALSVLENYAAKGDSTPLKEFASKTATVVKGHLDHVNTIRK